MVRFMTDRLISMGSLTALGVMAWCWGGEDSHRKAEKLLDSMDREEMERQQSAVYDGANYVAEETKEHAQLEEASQNDLSEELDGAEEGIKLFDDFIARKHQETLTTNDLQRICEVHGAEEEELNAELDGANKKIKDLTGRLEIAESQNNELREELSSKTFVQVREIDVCNNIGNLALMDDLQRANNNIESLFVSLEKAEARNDQIRDELFAKAYVEMELVNAREEIRILEKKLEIVTEDLKIANEKILEKSDLEEYVESADKEIRTLWAELDSVKAENKRLKTENVCEKAASESELNAAVEEVYRIGTKLDAVLEENNILRTELLIKKDLVCDLDMAEEELDKLWKEIAGVKEENRRLKRDLSEERATNNALMEADEKKKILEEEIRNLTSVADEFAIYKEKYQEVMERNTKLEMESNHKNYAISQLVDGLSQTHPELKELYLMDISGHAWLLLQMLAAAQGQSFALEGGFLNNDIGSEQQGRELESYSNNKPCLQG
ncbi:flagellar attachment zone protein 1-like [Palaemon carinicauda]|uniref:flagellar attachment zone protein 1-like n=1 Tax=Palaemon carinicauda TaxID=392227 RepID=UPI0035B65BCD